MDYSSWGVTWLGSWGNSWGPLHEVAETWDTAQGMARSNIKFTPIREVAVRIPATKIVVVSTTSRAAYASAQARASSAGAGCGVRQAKTGVRANAYSHASRHGGFISHRGVASSACAAAGSSSVVCGSGCRGAASRADAAVVARAARVGVVSKERYLALGVQNPSDEEMAAMVTMLVAKRTTAPLWKTTTSDIKRP